jgi:hypothetical protein
MEVAMGAALVRREMDFSMAARRNQTAIGRTRISHVQKNCRCARIENESSHPPSGYADINIPKDMMRKIAVPVKQLEFFDRTSAHAHKISAKKW